MKFNSKRMSIIVSTMALISSSIGLVVFWPTRQDGAIRLKGGEGNVAKKTSDQTPDAGELMQKSEIFSLIQAKSDDPDINRPVISSATKEFWSAESPDHSKIIKFNNQTQKFELTTKAIRNTVNILNWINIGGTDYEIVNWAWKDNNTLVAPGWSDVNKDNGAERRDVGDTKLFIYYCGLSKEPEAISGPLISLNKCIRLEGFNKNGQIILAEVFLDGYKRYGMLMAGEKSLGAFDILTLIR